MAHYGQGNSGPKRQVWSLGDRVAWTVQGYDFGRRGRITTPARDPNAGQTTYVWVRWDDGESGWTDPNGLDVA